MVKTAIKICHVLAVLIAALAVILVAMLLGPKLFGYDAYTVLSPSMEPSYKLGSLVYVSSKIPPQQVKAGEAISFHVAQGQVATHRVVEVSHTDQMLITKADASPSEELVGVPFSQYIGKVEASLPYLGYLSLYFQSLPGVLTGAVLLLLLVLLCIIPDLIRNDGRQWDEGSAVEKEA